MKVCIKENELNWNYHLVYGEERAVEDGYKIIEIPESYEDCAFEDFDNNGFNVELYNNRKQGYKNQNKLDDLTNWFDKDYPKYEQMFTRREALGKTDVIEDEFRNKTYHNIIELYTEAEVVAGEIRELRK